MKYSLLFLWLFSVTFAGCQTNTSNKNSWTILYYAAGCNSSEVDLMGDVAEMIDGLQSADMEIILLIDRIEGHSEDSTVLGSNFTDTKLFSIKKNSVTELSGGSILPELTPNTSVDLNLGDAETLKKFIQFGKDKAPAKHYALIMRSHGNGRRMCPDVELATRDPLWIGEMSKSLTHAESVDFLGLDVCSMAGIENFYQWKPDDHSFSADYILSSAPLSASLPYANIFSNIQEQYPNGTEDLSPAKFGDIHFQAIQLDQPWCSWSLINNNHIERVRSIIQKFESTLTPTDQSAIASIRSETLNYSTLRDTSMADYYRQVPHLDAADYYRRIGQSKAFTEIQRKYAVAVVETLDMLVLKSYYGNGFLTPHSAFINDVGGVYQVLPQLIDADGTQTEAFEKATSEWFTSLLLNNENAFGNYLWLLSEKNE